MRSTSGKGGKERVEKWDSLLWEKVGEGVRKRVVARWRETCKESYEKVSGRELWLLSCS